MLKNINSLKHMDITLDPILEEDIEMKEDLWEDAMAYYQMRLPIEKITQDYEKGLRLKVQPGLQLLRIHTAGRDELVKIVDVYNRAWLTSNTPFRPIKLDTMMRLFNEHQYTFLVGKMFGLYAGFAILNFEGNYNEYGVIIGMGITPRFQRRGIGTALGIAAWELFRKQRVQEIRCEVYVNNKKSYNFITSLGFEEFDVKVYYK